MLFRRVYKYILLCSYISISTRPIASMKMMMLEHVCFHFYCFDGAKIMELFEMPYKKIFLFS